MLHFLFGADWERDSEIGALVAAFTLLFAELTAAFVTEHRKGLRLSFVSAYTAVALVTVMMIILITYTTRHRGTRITGTWLSLSSLVLVAVFIWKAYYGDLPGQQLLPLRTTRYQVVDNDKTRNRLPGVEAIVPISDQHLTEKNMVAASSSHLTLIPQWDDAAYPEWKLEDAQMVEVSPMGVNTDTAASAELCRPLKGPEVRLSGLSDKTRYRLRLIFLPAGNDVDAWFREKDSKKKRDLHAKLVSEFGRKAKETRDKMAKDAAIQVYIDPEDTGPKK